MSVWGMLNDSHCVQVEPLFKAVTSRVIE